MTPDEFKKKIKGSNFKGMLSNKGAFPLDKQFAYQIKSYNYLENTYQIFKVTCPFIDKISVKGDANITSDIEKAEFQAMIEHKVKLKFHLDPSEYIIEDLKLPDAIRRRSRYRYHYKIIFFDGLYTANLLFAPFREGRFIKIEFSLKKFGKEGLCCLARWFSENIIHSTFYEFISEPDSLGELEIAIDCTGIPFKQFGFYPRKNQKEQIWQSRGIPQTVYMNAHLGSPAKVKVYDKSKQCAESGECNPYSDEQYVVRIEVKVRTKYSLTELKRIKSTHFRDIMVYIFSGHIQKFPAEQHWVQLFVDSALKRGSNATLTKFPIDTKALYKTYFRKQKIYFLLPFCDFQFWRETWVRTLSSYELKNLIHT